MKPICCIQSFIVFTLPGITVSRTVPSPSISTFWYLPPPPPYHPVPSVPIDKHSPRIHNNRRREDRCSYNKEEPRYAHPTSAPISAPSGKDGHRLSPPVSSVFSPPHSVSVTGSFPPHAARLPSFNLFTAESKSSSPASGLLQAIYRFLFPFST